MSKPVRVFGAIVFLSALVFGPAVQAQEMPVPENVTARAAPAGDAVGIAVGGLRAFPKVRVSGRYDDNIFAADSSTRSDSILAVAPAVLLRSDWSRHAIEVGAFYESQSFRDETKQDVQNWGFGSKGRLEIQDSSNLAGSVNYQRLTEDRSGINAPQNAGDPSQYDEFDGNLVLNHSLDQLTLALAGHYTDTEYRSSSQEFRDREVLRGVGQLGFNFSPGYNAFVRGSYNDRSYKNRNTVTPGNPRQDSDGYTIDAGIASEITNLVSGEAFVGYMDQNYESSAFRDVDGLSFGMNLEWSPTVLTTVRATASRTVRDTTASGAGGMLYTAGGLGLDHELLRNVQLQADVGFYNADYEGNPRDDDGFIAAVGATYMLTSDVHVDLRYEFDHRNSNISGQDFSRNQIMLGIELQR